MCFQMLSYEAIAIVANTWKKKGNPTAKRDKVSSGDHLYWGVC